MKIQRFILCGLFYFLISGISWGDSLYLVTSIDGPSDSAFFGTSVARIGDFNQDGYDDFAIGAPFYPISTSQPESLGIVNIFFGGSQMDTIPDLFLRPTVFSSYHGNPGFGVSIVGGKDLNGDGISDIAVGAPWLEQSKDAAYVFLGDTTYMFGDTLFPDTLFFGKSYYGGFGTILSMGNINGDSCDELAIGGSFFNYDHGAVAITFGNSESFSSTPIGRERHDFGYSFSIGDLNNDNYDELIIGSFEYKTVDSTVDTSAVFIYFGASNFDTIPDIILQIKESSWFDNNKMSIFYIKDLNADNFGDIIVNYSASNYDSVYIFLGGNPMNTLCDFSFEGQGYGVGDVNGDGNPDIAIIKKLPDTTSLINIYFGASDFDTIPDASISLTNAESIAEVGDLNGDRYDEIIIGDPYNDEVGENAGKVWIYSLQEWGIEESAECKMENVKLEIYPNPFYQITSIKYQAPNKNKVSLKIYDITGRMIKMLASGENLSNNYVIKWNGQDNKDKKVKSGIYFCCLTVDKEHYFKKVIFLKGGK